ncbi:MAG: hypothetical protein LBE95_01550 [Holosporaceae bacterium]|nr:hypothetical protein [Holosporaceae bacterium]
MRVNFIHQKEGLHVDETLSLIISNCSNYGYKTSYDENLTYTGKQLKELSFGNSTSWIDALHAISSIEFLRK